MGSCLDADIDLVFLRGGKNKRTQRKTLKARQRPTIRAFGTRSELNTGCIGAYGGW